MRAVFLTILAGSMFTVANAAAQDRLAEEIMAARAESFKVFDTDASGKADVKEVVAGAKSIFAALDADGNGGASLEEFQVISMGFEPLAESNSQKAAYGAARAAIFTRWDLNADGQISEAESIAAVLAELLSAADASVTNAQYGAAAFIAEMEASLK